MPLDDPYQALELTPGATDEEIRAAYLRKIKEHPPERDPAEFERIRDAYEQLRDPRARARSLLFSGDPLAPLAALLVGRRPLRRFVGPKPWLEALKRQ